MCIRDSRYKLSNGTELLWEQHPVGPDRVHVAGQESLDDLSPAAQEAVRAYYDAQGLLYRTYDELENAYAAYLESGRDPGFDSYLVAVSYTHLFRNEPAGIAGTGGLPPRTAPL